MFGIFAIVFILCIAASRFALQRYEDALARGSKESAPTAHTGEEIARLYLESEDIRDVEILEHRGVVSDYFDPSRRRLFLRPEIARGTTMAAWAVALHEAAHAGQTEDSLTELKWRQTIIRLNRYGPVLLGVLAATLMLLRVMPPRIALLMMAASCCVLLLLNFGTLAVETNANARLRRFLEKHLARQPSGHDRLLGYLSRMTTRELGDLFRSPRFFFFSALPGGGKSRPINKDKIE